MANDRDSFMREIDEELRREKFEKFWKHYGTYVAGLVGALIVALIGYKVYEARSISAAEAAGAKFESAVLLKDEKKDDEAVKIFEDLAKNGPRGYAALADLHLAGELVKAGKTAEAVAAFEALAKDGASDPLLKSYAELQAASARLGDADFTEMQNRLTPLSNDSGPWRNSARELLGVSAWKAGKFAEARQYLEPLLIDPNVRGSTPERVKIIMATIAAAELQAGAPAPSVPASTVPASAAPASAATPPPPEAEKIEKPAEPAK